VCYSQWGLDQNKEEGTRVSPRVVLDGGGNRRWARNNRDSILSFGDDGEEF
jgi:hypothetical protein